MVNLILLFPKSTSHICSLITFLILFCLDFYNKPLCPQDALLKYNLYTVAKGFVLNYRCDSVTSYFTNPQQLSYWINTIGLLIISLKGIHSMNLIYHGFNSHLYSHIHSPLYSPIHSLFLEYSIILHTLNCFIYFTLFLECQYLSFAS